MIRLEHKILKDAGEGYLSIFLPGYDSVIQGTWTSDANTSFFFNMRTYNTSSADGDSLNYKAFLAKGTYTFKLLNSTHNNRGIVKIKVDGVTVLTADGYSAGEVHNVITTQAAISITSSSLKNITLVVDGKNASSSSYVFIGTILNMYRTA